MFMPSSITVRRMRQGEVQQVLKVTPWTTTATARGLLRSLSGSLKKKKRPLDPTCSGTPKFQCAASQASCQGPILRADRTGIHSAVGKMASSIALNSKLPKPFVNGKYKINV